jgi:hypothetical protein
VPHVSWDLLVAIEELTAVVTPPKTPFEGGDEKTWRQIEKKLKVTFPRDYWDFIRTYGSGFFTFEGGGFVKIYNPFSRLFQDDVLFLCGNYLGFQVGEGRKAYPYKVFPKRGGILALGMDDLESNELYWITKGDPDQWKLLHRSRDNACEEMEGPLTTFLSNVFSGRLVPPLWSGSFPHGVKAVGFHAEPTPPIPDVDPTTIYDLYQENGNQTGFWVTTVDDNRMVYHIKTIGGMGSGPLVWPFEYEIIADCYANGELRVRETDLTMMKDHRIFLLVSAPDNRELPSLLLKNIYDLYRENGNKAGFWVRETFRPATAMFIKTVEGKESGPLSVRTVPQDRCRDYPVVTDQYWENKLQTSDCLLDHAEQNSFIRIAPP